MPFKFGISRRKSSGNALEDTEFAQPSAPAPSSFRVIPRGEQPVRLSPQQRASTWMPSYPSRHHSSENESGQSNRTSEGSAGIRSNFARAFDNSSTSARYSSTSTLPSSTDEDYHGRKPMNASDSQPFSIKNAARTFSFGRNPKASKSTTMIASERPHRASPEQQHPLQPIPPQALRDRSQTISSYASTAVPPKLEQELAFDTGDFGDMFSNLGAKESKRQSGGTPRALMSRPGTEPNPQRKALPQPPPPLSIDRNRIVEPSPYSWDSQHSNDNLIPRSSPIPPRSNQASPNPGASDGFHPARTSSMTPPNPIARRGSFTGGTVNAQGQVVDMDANIVRNSVRTSRPERLQNSRQSSARPGLSNGRQSSEDNMFAPDANPSPTYSSNSSTLETHDRLPAALRTGQRAPAALRAASASPAQNVTPRGRSAGPPKNRKRVSVTFEEEALASMRLTDLPFSEEPKPASPAAATNGKGLGKKMTAAEFERLRKEHEQDTKDEEVSDDEYVDEDEIEEKRRKADEKQRAEQMAKMALHRQMMSKTVGGSGEVDDARSRASGFLNPNAGNFVPNSNPGSSDEDDDTPLGILMEHGFPTKTRPPNHQYSSTPSIIGANGPAALPPRPASTSGSATSGHANLRASQPPFARRLPFDPLQPNTLINGANREQLGFGRSDASVYGGMGGQMGGQMGGPMAGGMGGMNGMGGPMGGMPQGQPMGGGPPPMQNNSAPTLVGIIHQEERSKAKRRGSPNPNAGANLGAGTFNSNGFQPRTDTFPHAHHQQQQFQQQQYQQQQMMMNPLMQNPMMQNPLMQNQMMQNQMMQGQMMPQQMMGAPQGFMQTDPNFMPPQLRDMFNQQVSQQVAFQTFRMGLEIGSGGGHGGSQPTTPRPGTPSQMGLNHNNTMPMSNNHLQPPNARAPSMHPQQQTNGYMGAPSPHVTRGSMTMARPNSSSYLDVQPNRNTTLTSMSMPILNGGDGRSVRGLDMGGGYAPSIAPSERSNIGQASRYRPVASQMGEGATSVTSSLTVQPTGQSTIRAVEKPKTGGAGDEDDDEGWGFLKKKKKSAKGKDKGTALSAEFNYL